MQSTIFHTIEIDTYKWKKKPLLIANLFFKLIFNQFDSIVISASSASTYLLLKGISKIKPSILFKIHYLVIGGYFPEGIRTKRYDWKIYNNLKSVVVEGEILKNRIIDALDQTILPDLKKHITEDFFMTPKDFESNYLSAHGAGFSIAPLFRQSAWFRFHNKAEGIKNLYISGAGTHPGAGLPGVLCSAKVIDHLIPAAIDFK
jgi:phytoene dehydrogenase-like protein